MAAPYYLIGSVLATIAAGLFTTLDTESGSPAWIGYQALGGIGIGVCFNIPVIITQAIVKGSDVAPATAMVLCKLTASIADSMRECTSELTRVTVFQSIGGTAVFTAAQAIFQNRLLQKLQETAPDVEPYAVIAAGANNLQKTFRQTQVAGIRQAYIVGLHDAFILSIAIAGVAAVVGITQPWRRWPKSQT